MQATDKHPFHAASIGMFGKKKALEEEQKLALRNEENK
jgi:hypothetical protein